MTNLGPLPSNEPSNKPNNGNAAVRFIIVTGLSGAGKTTALHALEELGFFTVDNLPPILWDDTLERLLNEGFTQIAVVADARARAFLGNFETALALIKAQAEASVVFLEAESEVLIRRYGFTRRTHPLGTPALALEEEQRVLAPLRALADVVIDTSALASRDLIARIRSIAGARGFVARIISFGFKYGLPRDADLVLDMRGLPNPYYIPELKPLSGLDTAVHTYVLGHHASETFFQATYTLAELCLERAEQGGRLGYEIAIGCTGGRHRSVTVAEALAQQLGKHYSLVIEHRDIEKSEGGP